MEKINHRRTKKKWRGQCLEVVVTRLVSCLFFTPVGRLLSPVSVSSIGYYCLLVHHINLLILPLLYLYRSTPHSRVFQEEEGGEAKIHQATGGEGQARSADEENEDKSPSKVGCLLLGVVPHGIRI